jgi:hypothetical protein
MHSRRRRNSRKICFRFSFSSAPSSFIVDVVVDPYSTHTQMCVYIQHSDVKWGDYGSTCRWWDDEGGEKSRLIFHSHRLNVFETECLNVLVRKIEYLNVCVHVRSVSHPNIIKWRELRSFFQFPTSASAFTIPSPCSNFSTPLNSCLC